MTHRPESAHVNKLAYVMVFLLAGSAGRAGAQSTPTVRPEASPPAASDTNTTEEQRPQLGIGSITLNILLQARYVATFNGASANPIPGYALRENYLARQGDGFRIRRLYLRMSAAPIYSRPRAQNGSMQTQTTTSARAGHSRWR